MDCLVSKHAEPLHIGYTVSSFHTTVMQTRDHGRPSEHRGQLLMLLTLVVREAVRVLVHVMFLVLRQRV
jgi:hypothetical protein